MAQQTISEQDADGEIYKVTGPVVIATGMNPQMYDVVQVGDDIHVPVEPLVIDNLIHQRVRSDKFIAAAPLVRRWRPEQLDRLESPVGAGAPTFHRAVLEQAVIVGTHTAKSTSTVSS